MFSSDKLNELSKLIGQLFNLSGEPIKEKHAQNEGDSQGSKKGTPVQPVCPPITPQRALVILGLLLGTLEVNSVLVNRDQTVQIFLQGSLKRKTRLEKIMDEIGALPFDEVIRAILGRF